jgi:hypothetical protein
MGRDTGLSKRFKASGTAGQGITVDVKGLNEAINDLRRLGDAKWIDSQIGLSLRDALKPALQYITRALPKVTGNLANSMIITNRKTKGDRSIRVGINSQASPKLPSGKYSFPAKYITMVEYGANGRGGYRIINNAYSAFATPQKVTTEGRKFMMKRIAKRKKFLGLK